MKILKMTSALLILGTSSFADEIYISAAASMTDVISEIKENYETNNPNINIIPIYAGTGTLAKQIQYGAPTDIFLSANTLWTNFLNEKGYLRKVKDITSNTLVITTSNSDIPYINKDDLKTLENTLENAEVISVASFESVPAGMYAKEALKNLNLLEKLYHKFVFSENVRTAVSYANLHEADFAINYLSDIYNINELRVIYEFPENTHDRIRYQAASTNNKPNTNDFFDYLSSNEVKLIFEQYNFKDFSPQYLDE